MTRRGVLRKVLAVAGTALVWFPILATMFTGVIGSIRAGVVRVDYLMPAELFPAALLGGVFLLWVSLRTRSRRKLVIGSLAGMILLLAGSQMVAVATGLASGEIEAVGLPWTLVLSMLAGFALLMIVLGVAGLLLARDLFKPVE